jgi:hypothetical protein
LQAFAKTTSGKGPNMPLIETRLCALEPKDKPYKVADDRGFYVEVFPAGGKLWRFRYRIGPVEQKLSIGAYPAISLKQARQSAWTLAQVSIDGRPMPRAFAGPSNNVRFRRLDGVRKSFISTD